MRILMVSNLYGALARGGAEAVVAAEAAALKAAGHEVVVVSGAPSSRVSSHSREGGNPQYDWIPAYAGMTLVDGIPNITYDPGNLCFYTELAKHGPVYRLWWHYLDIFNVGSAARLERIVREFKPDVVHTHNLMGLGFMIPSSLRRLKVRHVHTVHDVQLLDPSGLLPANREFRPAAHQTLYIVAMRMMMGSPATVIFPSEFHKRLHLMSYFFRDSRRAVVRNPSVPHVHAAASAKQGAASEKQPVFLFAGQLEKHKGIFDLLDAWGAANISNATLEIAGSGSQTVVVAARAAEIRGIKLLGRLDGAALQDAYARAKWLVLPSRVIENAPSSIMEAFAHGVPVMASASGGIPEIVEPGKSGTLFPPGSVRSLAAALSEAAAMDAAEYERFSIAASDAARLSGSQTQDHIKALMAAYQAK